MCSLEKAIGERSKLAKHLFEFTAFSDLIAILSKPCIVTAAHPSVFLRTWKCVLLASHVAQHCLNGVLVYYVLAWQRSTRASFPTWRKCFIACQFGNPERILRARRSPPHSRNQ